MTARTTVIDRHLGAVIRLRRRELGLSQQALADRIGVSFQQVQKYESGANRISASTLWSAAGALRMPPGAFFAGLGAADETGDGDEGREAMEGLVRDMLAQPDGLRLAVAWLATPDRGVRAGLIALAHAAARSARRPGAAG